MIVVYVDTETGGTLPQHPTISLASVAIEDGHEIAAFDQRIAFDETACDPAALAINHYTREAWTDAVSPAVCAARFAAWLRPHQCVTLTSKRTGQPYTVARLAGYNAATFDALRLRALFGATFCPWEYLVRDVLQRALFYFDERPWLPPPENFKLATVCARFEIPTDGAHGALADARMCAALAQRLQEAW